VAGALLFAEICLRWVGPKDVEMKRNDNTFHSFTWNETNSQYDEELGFFNRPSIDVVFKNTEYTTHVRTNSLGFRDDEESLNDPDILLLGDSFLFGWGVEENETAAAALEELTGMKALNMGVACYGTVQQFLLLRRFVEAEDLRGCGVLFLYYINDRLENFSPPGEIFPTLRKEGRRILFTPSNEEGFLACMETMKPNFATTISGYSAVFDLLLGQFVNPRSQFRDAWSFNRERWMRTRDEFPGIPVGPYETLEYLLRVLKLYGQERDLDVRFVFLPFLERYEEVDVEHDYDLERQVFRMVEMPFKDLSQDFSKEDFYPIDRHLNPRGQRRLGEAIAKYLKDSDFGSPSVESSSE